MTKETKPSQARREWTNDARAHADILAGNKSTVEIARAMHRSVKAIQHHYRASGISPLTGDGRITMAELSRRTDIPLQTLVEWASKGKLDGVEKVGVYWRVDLSAIGDIRPKWDGKKYLTDRLEELGVKPGEKLNQCINCKMALPRNASFFCSKRCRGEDMTSFADRKVGEKDKPENHFPPHLRIPFQDFLAGINCLERTELTIHADQLHLATTAPRNATEKLKEEFLRLKRYVMPDEHIYQTIYDEPIEVDRIKKLDKRMFDFRSDLVDASGVLRSPKIGYGLGAKIIIPRMELITLRLLWQKEEVPVSMELLSKTLASYSRTVRPESLKESVLNLRGILEGSDYQIVTVPQTGKRKTGGSSYLFQKIVPVT